MTQRQKRKPYIVGWEITSRCNLSCPHCFSSAATRQREEMTTAECKRIIDSMEEIGVSIIGWTGGEPLLRPDLEELIDYARQKGIKSNITTNAVLLDRARARSLLEAGNRAVQISLDGSTAERNKRMRGTTEEEFERIMEAIRACRDLNTRLYLATLLGQENLDDGMAMIDLAVREGIDSIRFCGYTPVGRGRRKDIKQRLAFSENPVDLLEFIDTVQTNDAILASFDAGFGPVPPDYTFHTCRAGIDTFYLKSNGDIYPCTALLHRRFRVGNLRDRPLAEIWNGPEIIAMAAFPRRQITGPCRDCDNFANCHGACRGTTFFHTGDLYASFPVCLYNVARQAAVR